MRNKIITLMVLITFAGIGFTQNYPSFPVGERWYFPDARSLSLGGAGSVSLSAPGAMLYNPAALTGISHSLVGEISLSNRKLEERRSYPLYDRFDGILGDGIYAINNNWYLQPEGAAAVSLPLKTIPGLTVALGSFVEVDQDYQYLEEVRKNIFGDSLMAYNRIEYDGTLRRYGMAIAAPLPFYPAVSVGMQMGMLKGSLDYLREVNFLKASLSDQVEQVSRSLDNTPLVFSLGAMYRYSRRISGGLDIALPYTVKYASGNQNNQKLVEEIKYPLRVNVGLEFRARQELQARLNVDFSYEFWSKDAYTSEIGGVIPTTQEFSDVYKLKVGIEHIFFNQVPFRVGMQYRNSFQVRGNTRTLLSAGTGFLGDNWQVDVAGAFSKASYRWPDLFDDALFGGDRSNSSIDDVDETYFFGQISVKYFLDFK